MSPSGSIVSEALSPETSARALVALQKLVRDIARDEVLPRFLKIGHSRKEDGSLFTEADLRAQEAFVAGLPQIIDSPVLGEEMTDAQQCELWCAHQQSGLWVVDPIDGTTNFANGIPFFALSAAWVQGGRSRLGVIYHPSMNELFSARAGFGAHLNDEALPLKHARNGLGEAVAAADHKYLRSGKLVSRMQTMPPFSSHRSLGSSTLDWCYAAAGRFDLLLHGGQKLWDYAAGALILQEAGGQMATLEGDDFWSGQNVFKRSVVAALQPRLFEEWLAWVRANA